jgi:peptidylprolyl isomerase
MGFTKEVLREGNPTQKPVRGKPVTVHCTGFGKNNDLNLKFWSTKDEGQQPFTFEIGLGKGK